MVAAVSTTDPVYFALTYASLTKKVAAK